MNRHRTRICNPHPIRRALALAVWAILPALGPAWAAGAANATLVSAPTRLAHGDAIVSALPMQAPLRVVVGLKLRDRAGLEAFVNDGAHAAMAGSMPKHLTDEQVMARFAPTEAQVHAVRDFLAGHGFTHITVSPSRMLVTADGTAANARDAFATTFARIRTHDGRFAYANTTEARVPAALSGTVAAVLGLQNVHVPHIQALQAKRSSTHPAWTVSGHSPSEFPSFYDWNYNRWTEVLVGVLTEGDLTQTLADLATANRMNDVILPRTQIIDTGGTSSDTSNAVEWALDSQTIMGVTGHIKRLVFYNMPSMTNTSLTANIDTVVYKNGVRIANASFGECELDAAPPAQGGDGSAAITDALFLMAVSKGLTFSIPTGNSGADECGNGGNTPSWPASSPYVIAVAGTHLETANMSWAAEQVWDGSGGSPSTFEPMPNWQKNFGVPGTMRGAADIAFDADPATGAIIYINGAPVQYGGTGLAASVFTGFWAFIVPAHSGISFAGPILYGIPASDFHDITSGRNSGGQSGVGFDAGPGYDFASGRGSFKMDDVSNDARYGGDQLIYDYSFEYPAAMAWVASPTTIVVSDVVNAYDDSRYARIGGDVSTTDQIQQTVAIPAGKGLATLSFELAIITADTASTANDVLSVRILDSNGKLLKRLATYSNLTANPHYAKKSLDMSPYIGQTVTIQFSGRNDAAGPTTWRVDEVSLYVY